MDIDTQFAYAKKCVSISRGICISGVTSFDWHLWPRFYRPNNLLDVSCLICLPWGKVWLSQSGVSDLSWESLVLISHSMMRNLERGYQNSIALRIPSWVLVTCQYLLCICEIHVHLVMILGAVELWAVSLYLWIKDDYIKEKGQRSYKFDCQKYLEMTLIYLRTPISY